jgi:hypothetical protein
MDTRGSFSEVKNAWSYTSIPPIRLHGFPHIVSSTSRIVRVLSFCKCSSVRTKTYRYGNDIKTKMFLISFFFYTSSFYTSSFSSFSSSSSYVFSCTSSFFNYFLFLLQFILFLSTLLLSLLVVLLLFSLSSFYYSFSSSFIHLSLLFVFFSSFTALFQTVVYSMYNAFQLVHVTKCSSAT